jgi:outer membrane protein TolC
MDAQIYVEEQLKSFRSFLGIPQDRAIRLILPDSVPQFSVPLSEALELAMEKSPDPVYYERIRREAESNLSYAKANTGLKADIYLHFGLSQTGNTMQETYARPLTQEYASISLSLPILDWGRGQGKVRVARSQRELVEIQAEQGMEDFRQNVHKLVSQFNMQARRVHIARLTGQRADHRHTVSMRLYIMGENSLLDLNEAISERNSARRSYLSAMSTYWSLYYTLRSITGYDFRSGCELTEQLPIK